MTIRRLTAALALAGVAMLAAVTPAFAHAELTGSNPAKGASLDKAPTQVQLTFGEAVSPKSITVTGPEGTQWTVGQVAVAGPVVTAPVQAIGPAGPYKITYVVTSDDGDDVTGTVDFTMAVAATPSPTAPAPSAAPGGQAAPTSSDSSGGVPAWVWILIAVAVIAAAGGAVLARRGRGSGPAER